MFFFEKRTKNFLIKLRGKTRRKSCCVATQDAFQGILTGALKHEICCSNNSHVQSKTATFYSSKLRFFDRGEKSSCQPVDTICAEFSELKTNSTATLKPSCKKAFCAAFRKKRQNPFLCNYSLNPNLTHKRGFLSPFLVFKNCANHELQSNRPELCIRFRMRRSNCKIRPRTKREFGFRYCSVSSRRQ